MRLRVVSRGGTIPLQVNSAARAMGIPVSCRRFFVLASSNTVPASQFEGLSGNPEVASRSMLRRHGTRRRSGWQGLGIELRTLAVKPCRSIA